MGPGEWGMGKSDNGGASGESTAPLSAIVSSVSQPGEEKGTQIKHGHICRGKCIGMQKSPVCNLCFCPGGNPFN